LGGGGAAIGQRKIHSHAADGIRTHNLPLTHLPFLSTTLHYHLCLCCVSIPHILYQIICKLIVWASKRFQIKKLSNKASYLFEVYNFHLWSFTIWGRLKNLNFKFEKFKRSFCMTRWFQINKLSNTKFHNFSRPKKIIREFFHPRSIQKIKFKSFHIKL
jgi:hypothetical protein